MISEELRKLVVSWLHAVHKISGNYIAGQRQMFQELAVQVGFRINREATEKGKETEGAAFAESDPKYGSPHGPSVDHLQG
jgi:hypothetical protein